MTCPANFLRLLLVAGSLLLGGVWLPAVGQDAEAGKATYAEIRQLFEQAHQALRAGRRADAVAPVQHAIALSERFPAGSHKRIETLSQAATLLWSVNHKDLAEASLLAAVRQIDAAAKPAPQEIVRVTYHMLGVIYRDDRRHAEAVPWFQRSVNVAASLPETTADEAETKYFALASELRYLAWAQCRADDSAAANASDRRRIESCSRQRRPTANNACRDGLRTCVNRWMSQSD